MRELIEHLTTTLRERGELILCQVVETKGSTPQKAGALMLVSADAGQKGTLGGGCVEGEVKQKAIRLFESEQVEIHEYILDHDYAWADGLICGGKMVILAEALRGKESLDYFQAYQIQLDSGEGFTEAVVVGPEKAGCRQGERFLIDAKGQCVAARFGTSFPAATLQDRIVPLHERPRPSLKGGIAVLPTLPRIKLVIVGAGHVGQEVALLAAHADFDVWVIDDRRQYANKDRFPAAKQIVVGPLEQVIPELEITPHTYALIVTRGHGHDQEALELLAPTAATYVGLIGSQRKIKLIFENIKANGMPAATLARVKAPIGVDIGSQTVPEIGISVVAELISWRNLGPRPVTTR